MTAPPVSRRPALFAGHDPNKLLTLAEAAALIPGRRRGRSVSIRVLLRWALQGVRGRRLNTVRVGQRHLVRISDLVAFLEAIAPSSTRPTPRPSIRSATRLQARRAALARRAAEEDLR